MSSPIFPSSVASSLHENSVKCESPWALLREDEPYAVWRERGGDELWIALGELRATTEINECREWLLELGNADAPFAPRCFGAIAFDSDQVPRGEWKGFAARRFVLPRALVLWVRGNATVLRLDRDYDLRFCEHISFAKPKMVGESVSLGADTWREAVVSALHAFEHEHLAKVVLSERCTLEFESKIAFVTVLESLAANSDSTLLAWNVAGAGTFVGASPELLFRVSGNEIEVESLAGTRRRGQSVAEDDALALELERSRKERREQDAVTQFLQEKLSGLCATVHSDAAPAVRRLPNVQHLQTRLRGLLRTDVTLREILAALHPTPAVCGSPTGAAKSWILAHEPHMRGLYTGAIGWVSASDAEFVVGIRSGLLQGSTAYIYAGAGIVPGSIAEKEYVECEWKMSGMRRAILG